MSKSRHKATILLALVLFLAGCAGHKAELSPQPVRPVPAAFSQLGGEMDVRSHPWWTVFKDERLEALLAEALGNNLDLNQGMARIEQAQALLQQARAAGRPQLGIGLETGGAWERDLEFDAPARPSGLQRAAAAAEAIDRLLSELGVDNVESNGSSGGSGEQGTGASRDESALSVSSGLSLRWELDLWGRLRALTNAQREELAALLLEQSALRLSLSGAVAEAYYAAMEQRLQYNLLTEQRKLAQTFLELLELRFSQGGASAVDLLQQRDQLAEIDAEVPVALAQLGVLENRLDVLLGTAPDGVDRVAGERLALPAAGALPRIGVPADLLQRRPDLLAAQRRVVAADERIGMALAERLPQVTLSGDFLYGNATGPTGAALDGGLVANLFQPLLDWGLRKAAVDAAGAAYKISLIAYTQDYLLAMEEVESTLWQEARQRELLEALGAREDLLRRTVEETQVRYGLGVTDYLPVITALQNLQRVQREYLRAESTLVRLRIRLILAAGGAVSDE